MDNTTTPIPGPAKNPWESRDPVRNLVDAYQFHHQLARSSLELGIPAESVRASALRCLDLVATIAEAAVNDAIAGVSEPTRAAEEAYAMFPAVPRSMDN